MTTIQLKRYLPQNFMHLFLTAIIVGGVVAGVILLRTTLDNRQQAAISAGTATLTLNPTTSNLQPGQKATVDLYFDSKTDAVDGIQVYADVSGTVPSDIAFVPVTIPGLSTAVQTFNQPDPAQPTKRLVLLMLAPPTSPAQPYRTNSVPVKIGSFTFTAPASGTMNVTFDPQNSLTTQTSTGIDILKTPTAATYKFLAGTKTSTMYFSTPIPVSPQTVNKNFTTDVMVDAGNNQISGVDSKITYDPSALKVVSVLASTASPFNSYPALTNDAVAGVISVSGNVGSGTTVTPVTGNGLDVAKITFTPLKAITQTAVNFSFAAGNLNDSNVVTYVTSGLDTQDILTSVTNLSVAINAPAVTPSPSPVPTPTPGVTPSPIPTPSPTPSPTPTPSPKPTPTPSPSPSPSPVPQGIILKINLQGRHQPGFNYKPYTLIMDYQLAGSLIKNTLNISVDSTGQGTTILPPGNYVFLMKVPAFLDKKFGSAQTPVQIGTSTTQLDFTTYTLLGGDFNNDGVVNEVDYTLNFLPKFKTTDALVDLDGSGEVNNLDFALMRSNWLLTSDLLP